MPRCRATIAATGVLLLAACTSTTAGPTPTTASSPTSAPTAPASTAAPVVDTVVPFAFEAGASGLRFERPASWRVLDVVQPTMASIAMLTNGPSHDPCTSGPAGTTCSTPVDALADGQVVVMVTTSGGPAEGAQPVSEQLERLTGEDAVVSGRPVRIDRDAAAGCVAGADHGIAVSAPAELPDERVEARFCWRGDTDGTIAHAVDAAIASMTLAPMAIGVAVPSVDHWPVAGSGPGWELRAQAMPTGFECLDLTLDGRRSASACFRVNGYAAAGQLPVQIGLMQAVDGKRFAYGVLGDDTPAVLEGDGDAPISVNTLPADGRLRVFVTQVETWATGTCDAFELMETLEATRPGERPTVLPPLCGGDEADLYLLTGSATNENGRVVTFRRNPDRTWRVAFDPWGVQTG